MLLNLTPLGEAVSYRITSHQSINQYSLKGHQNQSIRHQSIRNPLLIQSGGHIIIQMPLDPRIIHQTYLASSITYMGTSHE
jgi:hypothetical protein